MAFAVMGESLRRTVVSFECFFCPFKSSVLKYFELVLGLQSKNNISLCLSLGNQLSLPCLPRAVALILGPNGVCSICSQRGLSLYSSGGVSAGCAV